jgi:hypothetical protein
VSPFQGFESFVGDANPGLSLRFALGYYLSPLQGDTAAARLTGFPSRFWEPFTDCDLKVLGEPVTDCDRFNWPVSLAESKHEVGWKSASISLDRLIESLGGYAVERGQVGIQQDFFATQQ